MRKLLLFISLIAIMLCVSCKKKDKEQKIWNPNATVLIKPDQNAFIPKASTKGGEYVHLSALEIVQKGDILCLTIIYSENKELDEPLTSNRGFSENQKDYSIPALKMWGTDIIDQDGVFVKDFLYAYDMVITDRETNDTLAYIPNKVVENARIPIEQAYNEKRYEDVYKMFDEAFTYRPCTGAEWRELKAQGKQ